MSGAGYIKVRGNKYFAVGGGWVIRAGRSERSEILILGAASVASFSYWAQRAVIKFSSAGRSERGEFFAGRSERSEFFILGAASVARKTKQGAASKKSSQNKITHPPPTAKNLLPLKHY